MSAGKTLKTLRPGGRRLKLAENENGERDNDMTLSAGVRLLAALLIFACAVPPADAAGRKTAFFPFEWVSFSAEAQRADEVERLKMIGAHLRELLIASGAYDAVDLAPAADAIAKARKFSDCRDCAEEIARSAGAEVAVTAWIQKVSNLILNINIVISEAGSSKLIAVGSADIRGNNDVSWRRGVEWLVKNRLTK